MLSYLTRWYDVPTINVSCVLLLLLVVPGLASKRHENHADWVLFKLRFRMNNISICFIRYPSYLRYM